MKAKTEFFRDDYVAIGIPGVTMWNAEEWEDIQLSSKICYIAFDADAVLNVQVARQGLLLTLFLYGRGAKRVQALFWDLNLGKGVDDYLVTVEKSGISPQTALTELLENAKDAVEFFAYYLGFQDVINVCANAVIRWKTPVESLFESFAKILKIGKTALKKAVQNAIEKKIQELREKAIQAEEEKVKKLFGLENIKMPEGYACVNGKLAQIAYTSDPKNGQTRIEFLPICPFFLPAKILKNEEEKETYISLQFLNGDEIKINSDVSDTKKLANVLSNAIGVPLDAKRIKKISSFIADFVSMNQIPTQKAIKRTGWSEDGKTYYLPSLSQDVVWMSDRDGRLEGIHVSDPGNEEEVLTAQAKMLLKMLNHKAGISSLAVLAAPLVAICKTPNFVLNYSGTTDTGKTTAHRFAMSLYGDPEKLITTLDTTHVGNERVCNVFRDFPVWFDELETMKTRELHQFVSLVYQYTQGKGRTRSNIYLDIRPTAVFRGIMLTSMEHDLETIMEQVANVRVKPRGLARRVLEIQGNLYTPFNPKITLPSFAEINHFSTTYYGAFGKSGYNTL